ncbi:MAG: zinc ABC transporter substrate-binding protein, partial [Spirochaetales bacterium]|nr:zinc ABC transporter substrate-binding protein [Spirochaetales bacterium]
RVGSPILGTAPTGYVYKEHKMIKPKHFPATQIIVSLLLILAITIPLTGCAQKKGVETLHARSLLSVFVSIEPQKYFVERIGGEYIEVEVMVKEGQNPATYEPTPMQIGRLGTSSAFFSIGVPFEKAFLKQISSNLPNLILVDTSKGIEKREITGHDHEEDSEIETHTVTEQLDPHIWMSPILVQKQAEIIVDTLIKLKPEYTDYFTTNYNQFITDLNEVHQELKESLSNIKGSTLFVYHPSFGYFADLYGLKQIAIEAAGKEPSPRILEAIIKEIISNNVKIIFVQPEFQSSSIKVITKATGAAVISVNPLSYDYLNNLRSMANILNETKNENRNMETEY